MIGISGKDACHERRHKEAFQELHMINCHKSVFIREGGKNTRRSLRDDWRAREGRVLRFLPVFALLISFSFPVLAQEAVPQFFVDVVSAKNYDSEESSRVDVYARISYARLNFITTPNGFTANYELSLSANQLSDDDRFRNLVQSKIWDGNIVVDTYLETQADDKSDFTTQTLDLSPGRYIFEFELSDKNSSQVYVQEVPITVRDFDVPVGISDLTLLESYDADSFSIVPRVGKNVSTADGGFQLFYEINTDEAQELSVRRDVFRTVRDGGIPVAPAWMDLDTDQVEVVGAVFTDTEPTSIGEGKSQHVATIPLEDIKAGAYVVRVSLNASDGTMLDSAEKAIIVQWTGLAAHIQDIDEAIQQLEYTAKPKDIDFILDAPNQLERVQRFENFWEKRDPTPKTKRNEIMEEYYYRVASANQQYGAVRDGWRTDRGFVFVNYGEPDYVERQPFNFDYEPYEVWTYERIGRRFIFVDKTGFGDYELLVPVWDERNRLY